MPVSISVSRVSELPAKTTTLLPSGNLAPSSKKPISIVKNVSQKVAQVFGDDDSDEVKSNAAYFFIINYNVIIICFAFNKIGRKRRNAI